LGLFGGGIFKYIKARKRFIRLHKILPATHQLKWTFRKRWRFMLPRILKRVTGPAMSFGSWGFLFSTYDCMFLAIRRKEDLINPILSGALTGATLSFGSRTKRMIRQAFMGAVIIGLIEAVAGFAMGSSPELPQRPFIEHPQTAKEQQKPQPPNSRALNWIDRFFRD